jgi:hypothetical protein
MLDQETKDALTKQSCRISLSSMVQSSMKSLMASVSDIDDEGRFHEAMIDFHQSPRTERVDEDKYASCVIFEALLLPKNFNHPVC